MQARSYTPLSDSPGIVDLPDMRNSTEATLIPGLHLPGAKSAEPTARQQAAYAFATHRAHFALLAARIAGDGVLLTLAFVLAYWLRYQFALGRTSDAPEAVMPLSAFTPYILIYAIGTLIIFRMRGLYALSRGSSWLDHMVKIAGGALIGVSAITLGTLFFTAALPGRLVFVYLWLCTLVLFAAERFAYRRARMWLWRRGVNVRKALVIGTSVAAQRIMKDILERPELGYTLLGFMSDVAAASGSATWRVPINRRVSANLRWLGSLRDVESVIHKQRPHEVIVVLPPGHHARTLTIVDNCRELGVEFKLVPDLCDMRFNEVRIDALNGVPLIGVKNSALHGANLLFKRVIDLTLVLLALLVAALPMMVIAVAIKMTSPGTVFFRQKRVGKNGREFICYKFRSMYTNAEARLEELRHLNEADGPIFKMKNDPRLTRLGKFLRRSSLDELPQLFNILLGDMSWVGPRPPTPAEVEKYNDWQLKRLEVAGGLTGLWQVSGRSNLSFDEMMKLDMYYAENWSLAFDIMIMLRTVPAVLKRAGAY